MWPTQSNPIDFQPQNSGNHSFIVNELVEPISNVITTAPTSCSVNENNVTSKEISDDDALQDAGAFVELSSDSNDSFNSNASLTDLDQIGSSELSDINVTGSEIDELSEDDLNLDEPEPNLPNPNTSVALEYDHKPTESTDPPTKSQNEAEESDSAMSDDDDNNSESGSYTTSSVEEEPEEERATRDNVVEIISSQSSNSSDSENSSSNSSSADEFDGKSDVEKVVGFVTSLVKQTDNEKSKKSDDKEKSPHKYFCSQCGKTYSRIFNMKRHERYECGVKGEHVCNACGKTYSLKRNLSRHEKYECGRKLPKEFICTMCGKTFCRKGSLTRHEQNECGKEPNLQCPYCKHKSKRDDHLFEHIRKCHFSIPTKKKVRRGGTKKSEKKQQEIERRLERNRLKDAARKYGCERCGKRYTLHRTLRCHEKVCGREQTEEYFCCTCNKRFFWKGNLTRHEKFECGKDLFHECLYCPYKTKRSDILSHHQNKCHQNPTNMMKTEEPTISATTTILNSSSSIVSVPIMSATLMDSQVIDSSQQCLNIDTMKPEQVANIPYSILANNMPNTGNYTLKMASSLDGSGNHLNHDVMMHSILPNLRLKTEMNEMNHC